MANNNMQKYIDCLRWWLLHSELSGSQTKLFVEERRIDQVSYLKPLPLTESLLQETSCG